MVRDDFQVLNSGQLAAASQGRKLCGGGVPLVNITVQVKQRWPMFYRSLLEAARRELPTPQRF